MASKTEIANRALVKLGQPRVSNIETDSSASAVTINRIYDSVLKSCQQQYPWNFAVKRTSLAPDANAPSWGWATAFTLPSDCLQLLEIKDEVEYQTEGGKILCDEATIIYIKYVALITDEALFPPLFAEFFAQQLALESSVRITDDTGLRNSLLVEMRDITDRAFAADAVENWPEKLVEDDWLRARL